MIHFVILPGHSWSEQFEYKLLTISKFYLVRSVWLTHSNWSHAVVCLKLVHNLCLYVVRLCVWLTTVFSLLPLRCILHSAWISHSVRWMAINECSRYYLSIVSTDHIYTLQHIFGRKKVIKHTALLEHWLVFDEAWNQFLLNVWRVKLKHISIKLGLRLFKLCVKTPENDNGTTIWSSNNYQVYRIQLVCFDFELEWMVLETGWKLTKMHVFVKLCVCLNYCRAEY